MRGGVGLFEQFEACFPDCSIRHNPSDDSITVSRRFEYTELAALRTPDRTVMMARSVTPILGRGRRRRLHYGKKH